MREIVRETGSALIGGAVGGGVGAATALSADVNNRQLHQAEVKKIRELAHGDSVKEAKLVAAACALVKCAAEYAPGSQEYAFWKAQQDLGAQYSAEQALLSKQTGRDGRTYGPLFQYTWGQQFTDSAKQINASYQLTTRAGGALQAVGGFGTALGGATVTAGGAISCPETGVGCLVAAGGAALTLGGLDQFKTGASTFASGKPHATLGGQYLQSSLGISAQTAELLYAVAGMAPAAAEGYLASKALNAQAKSNSAARATYAGSESGVAKNSAGKAGTTVVDQAATGMEWGKGIKGQGMPYEDYVASTLPAETRLPANFKTFDFFDETTGVATSVKTLDTTTAAKVAKPSQVYSSLKGNVDAVANFTEAKLSGTSLKAADITVRELNVAIPANTTPAQWTEVNKAIQYGQSKGVTVKITVIK